jgi:hypothetical protein
MKIQIVFCVSTGLSHPVMHNVQVQELGMFFL